jgi:hypothetical protein
VVRGFASVGLFPTCGFLVVVASLVCSGLHGVVLWDVWPVLPGICAWRLSGSLPGVSHHCLSILQIARCFSPGAPPRRHLRSCLLGYSSGLVACRCLAPACHAWLVEVSLCMTLSCKDFLLKKKRCRWYPTRLRRTHHRYSCQTRAGRGLFHITFTI